MPLCQFYPHARVADQCPSWWRVVASYCVYLYCIGVAIVDT